MRNLTTGLFIIPHQARIDYIERWTTFPDMRFQKVGFETLAVTILTYFLCSLHRSLKVTGAI